MNSVRIDGAEFAGPGPLIQFVLLAIELSEARHGEVEVFLDEVKVRAFARGRSVFPRTVQAHRVKRPRANGMLQKNRRQMISEALASANGRMEEAAKLLGIGRTTLYRELKAASASGI